MMLVKMEILIGSEVVEDYTVPDGSWIQTRTIGAQHVPALDHKEKVSFNLATIIYTPVNPPHIPEKLRKLLNGNDKRWGKNGFEWMGASRQRAGGTIINRLRNLKAKMSYADLPLLKNKAVCAFLEGVRLG